MTSEQILALRALGRQAALDLCRFIVNHSDELVELAVARASTLGTREYGDSTYAKNVDEIRGEMFDELADAIFYRHVALLKFQQARDDGR